MKRLSFLMIVLFVAFGLVLPVFAADGLLDNPVYKSWAKFKVGAMAKYKQEMDMAGNKNESEIVYSLVELTPEKAVVEMKVTATIMGNKSEMPATKMEYLAKVPTSDPALAAAPQAQVQAQANSKQGDEEIEVAGKKMKCHFIATTMEQAGSKIISTVYSSDEVPGTLVKSVTTMDQPVKTATTIVLVETKAP